MTGQSNFAIESYIGYLQTQYNKDDVYRGTTRKQSLGKYVSHGRQTLLQEHFVQIVRDVLQSLGRVERIERSIVEQEIYINEDIVKKLSIGIRTVPEIVPRASATQRAVLDRVTEYEEQSRMFDTPLDRSNSETGQALRENVFANYTTTQPQHFRDRKTRHQWEVMFDHSMFSDPAGYLKRLEAEGLPPDFIDSLFMRQEKKGCPLFVKQVTGLDEQEISVITDIVDAITPYEPMDILIPGSLRTDAEMKKILKKIDVNLNKCFGELVPYPWFARDIMKGYLGELILYEVLFKQYGIRLDSLPPVAKSDMAFSYLDIEDHPQADALYQQYDCWLQGMESSVVGIDMKSWSRMTDAKNVDELRNRARTKHATVSALLGVPLHAIYVNLCSDGSIKITTDDEANRSIRFMSLFVRTGHDDAWKWILNTNFIAAIMGGK